MDVSQFFGKAFPLGSVLPMAYQGPLVVAADGSEWLPNVHSAPFPYTSDYSATPASLLSPHPLINGPWDSGYWSLASSNIAIDVTNNVMLLTPGPAGSTEGDATNGYFYYTTTDGGATWTRRTFPNTKSYQVFFAAGKFIGHSLGATANAVITSTDGVTWSSFNAANIGTLGDAISDGANNIVVVSFNATPASYSTDGGATWATATLGANSAATGLGSGGIAYLAAAGLFMTPSGSLNGAYHTSPTGATWTNRTAQSTYLPYGSLYLGGSSTKFAANATRAVAVGSGGFFQSTTDGLTWGNRGFVGKDIVNAISLLYWDGTYFVACYNDRVFYSTTGTGAWTEGRRLLGSARSQSSGRVLGFVPATGGLNKAALMTNPAATTPQTVMPPLPAAYNGTAVNHYRIK